MEGWGQVERVVSAVGKTPPFVAALGDGASERAAVIWTCCGDATFVSAEATHYAAFGRPGAGDWHVASFPFVSGAVAAADTAAAQAPGSGSAWLAWVENVHAVHVRAIDLSRLIDAASGLPAPTEAAR